MCVYRPTRSSRQLAHLQNAVSKQLLLPRRVEVERGTAPRWRAPRQAAMARHVARLLVGCLLVLGATAQRSHRGTLEVTFNPSA